MSFEQIASIILIGSLSGIAFLIYRKIPVLAELPRTAEKPLWKSFGLWTYDAVKNMPVLKSISFEIFLHKLLSKIRILTLKTDSKTSSWLKRLRIKAKIKKNLDGSYWEEIKKVRK